MDDATALTDREERALEAIRRQLDMEFPHAARGVVFAWHVTPEVERAAVALPAPKRRRLRRLAIVAGTLLLAFAAGGAVGALVTMFYAREPGTPTVDRDAPRPTPSTVTQPLGRWPTAEKALTPTPRATAPARRASPPENVATPAPAPAPVEPVTPATGGAAATAPAAPIRSSPESP